MEKTDINQDVRLKVYEIGYLLVPTIPEEHLPTEVQNIKSVIEKNEGVFITEDFPKLRALAYKMTLAVTGQNSKFDKAYFGWVKFEASSAAASVIEKDLKKNPMILRSMIIKTVRENTMYTQKSAFRPVAPVASEDGVKVEDAPKMTEEEMDKTIENLVVE